MADSLDPSNDEPVPQQIVPSPDPDPQAASKRGLVVGGVILGVVLVVAVGMVFAYRNLVGEPFAAAETVPPDADVVISFDLLQVRDTDRIDRLVRAFAEPLAAAGEVDAAEFDLVEAIDEELEAELGITLTADVIPWIGRSVSIAAWVPPDLEDDPDVLASVAVRDRGAAAAAVERLVDQATTDSGATVERSEVRGGDRWLVAESGDPTVVVWLDDDVMLLASSMRTINRALDAREGASLIDEAAFNEVVAELPPDRLLTVYVGSSFFEAITDLTLSVAGEPGAAAEAAAIEAIGLGFTLRDDGVQFDLAQVLEATADVATLEVPDDAVNRLPAETLGYVAFAIPEGAVDDSLVETLRSTDPLAFDAMREDVAELLGVDLFDALIPAFAGDAVVAVIEARAGIIAEQAGVPLGVVGALGVVDRDPVATALESGVELLEDQGLVFVGEVPTAVVVEGEEVLAYALTDDMFVIGSPPTLVGDYLGGAGGLTDGILYRELDGALVGEGLSMYVDLERSLRLVREFDEDLPVLPLRGVGASGRNEGRVTRGSLLVLIDY